MELSGKVIIFDSEREAAVWHEVIRRGMITEQNRKLRLEELQKLDEIKYEAKQKLAEIRLITSIL